MPATNKFKTTSTQNNSVNPFARALAETEKGLGDNDQRTSLPDQNSLLSQALARTGGHLGDNNPSESMSDPDALRRQQEEAAEKQKKELQRRRLHEQINPVETTAVFNAQEKRVTEELEKTRKELRALLQEVKGLYKDVDIQSFKQVVNPGQEGKYYISFFQQLRIFIMFLRQKVHSARTWAQQMHSKSSKRKNKHFSTGIDFGGQNFEQSKSVFDTMHHERSTSYSGG
jgi:hypothetical protein